MLASEIQRTAMLGTPICHKKMEIKIGRMLDKLSRTQILKTNDTTALREMALDYYSRPLHLRAHLTRIGLKNCDLYRLSNKEPAGQLCECETIAWKNEKIIGNQYSAQKD